MADDERERAIAAIVPRSKPPSSPRWLWIVALVVGGVCAIAFLVAMVRGGDAGSTTSEPTTSHSGFSGGLLIGALVGMAVGWFAHAHSSRNKP